MISNLSNFVIGDRVRVKLSDSLQHNWPYDGTVVAFWVEGSVSHPEIKFDQANRNGRVIANLYKDRLEFVQPNESIFNEE